MPEQAKLRIEGVEYEFPEELTLGEARAVKKISGLRPGPDLSDALREGDPDAIVALVWVIKHRADPSVSVADIESMLVSDIGDAEADAGPPDEAAASSSVTTPQPSGPQPSEAQPASA